MPKDALIELVKGVFGLREPPRLRWLRLRKHILAPGVVESRFSPATFEIYDTKGNLCGVLNVHVDDGLWPRDGELFEQARKKVRQLISIGKEQRGSFEFLGRHITQSEDFSIRANQHEYVTNIEPIDIPADIQKTGASVNEKRVAMDSADSRAGADAGDLVVWVPTRRMVADSLTRHKKTQRGDQRHLRLAQEGHLHVRFTDEEDEHTLIAAQ